MRDQLSQFLQGGGKFTFVNQYCQVKQTVMCFRRIILTHSKLYLPYKLPQTEPGMILKYHPLPINSVWVRPKLNQGIGQTLWASAHVIKNRKHMPIANESPAPAMPNLGINTHVSVILMPPENKETKESAIVFRL